MVTTITITRSRYTTSVLSAMGHQRARTRITEDLCSKQTLELLTKGPTKATGKAELQIKAAGETEAHTYLDLYSSCTMAILPIIVPKIAPSTFTPNGK
jgi:hypothetical protein